MSATLSHDAACTRCRFFDDHARATDAGLCRFNPPVSQPSESERGLWPVVSAGDWCGHFAADSATAGTAD